MGGWSGGGEGENPMDIQGGRGRRGTGFLPENLSGNKSWNFMTGSVSIFHGAIGPLTLHFHIVPSVNPPSLPLPPTASPS